VLRNRIVLGSLVALVAVVPPSWAMLSSIDPPAVLAITQRRELSIFHEPGETYNTMLERAEEVAQMEIQQLFDADIVTSDISIVVMGENGGLIAPLLSVDVRRDQWRRHPDIMTWARYYTNARELLGLNAPPPEPSAGSEPVLGTGDVQVTLRWATTDDLDLAVTDPSGDTTFFANPSVPSGGQLDVDSNAGCGGTTRSPVENVFWPTGGAPQGEYMAAVNLFSRCEDTTGPISFEITILVQGQSRTETGTVSDANPTVTFPFSLP